MTRNDIKSNDKLVKIIREDPKLFENPELKMEMVAMATMFLADFSNNLYKTSIDLNTDCPYYSIDEWKDFLNYPIVRKYIKSFQDEKINIIADQGLSKGDKDAIGIKKAMLEGSPAINNSNIIIVRVPEKVKFD